MIYFGQEINDNPYAKDASVFKPRNGYRCGRHRFENDTLCGRDFVFIFLVKTGN